MCNLPKNGILSSSSKGSDHILGGYKPMSLADIFERYPDQESCISHLERIRWKDNPHCPHCASVDVARKQEGERVGRWNCHDCKSSFNVLSGTMFQNTHIPLQKWFLGVQLVMNAKKSLSSYQLGRDLSLNQKTAWYMHCLLYTSPSPRDS